MDRSVVFRRLLNVTRRDLIYAPTLTSVERGPNGSVFKSRLTAATPGRAPAAAVRPVHPHRGRIRRRRRQNATGSLRRRAIAQTRCRMIAEAARMPES